MRKVTLVTSKKSNRYQHIKWLLQHLKFQVEHVETGYLNKHKIQEGNGKTRNPTLIDSFNNIIQGENAILTWAVLEATKNADNQSVPSKERTLLGYSTADVLQVESLLEILTEIQRFAYDCILYSTKDVKIPIATERTLNAKTGDLDNP